MRDGRVVTPSETREQTLKRIEEERRRLPPRMSDVPIDRCSAPVDEETAAALIRAWRHMLRNIGPPPDMVMFDGVNYRFSMEIGGRSVEGQIHQGGLSQIADAMADYCSTSRRTGLLKLWAGGLLAAISLVPAILLLSFGFQRATGRRVPGMHRLGSVFRRRGFGAAYALVSIVLISILVYAAIAGGNSREVLGLAQVILSGR
jgi:hypothetical protein